MRGSAEIDEVSLSTFYGNCERFRTYPWTCLGNIVAHYSHLLLHLQRSCKCLVSKRLPNRSLNEDCTQTGDNFKARDLDHIKGGFRIT